MLHEIQELKIGILFDNAGLHRLSIPLDCVKRIEDPDYATEDMSRKPIPSWEEADHEDARVEMKLALKPWSPWWLLQFPVWTGETG